MTSWESFVPCVNCGGDDLRIRHTHDWGNRYRGDMATVVMKRHLLIGRVKGARLTYLDWKALVDLHDATDAIEGSGMSGAVIEAGCALGGSAIVLARAKNPLREMLVYDVFGMIPPPGPEDGPDVAERYAAITEGKSEGLGGDTYYGYQEGLLEKVTSNFELFGLSPAANNVTFISGLFEDTLKPPDEVALAHIDSDWYNSVKICLERIGPKLVSGGRMVIDDYDSWSGCKKAVDEFLDRRGNHYQTERKARLHLVRR